MHILISFKELSYICERSLPEKDVNEKVYIFTKTIKNIFSNFIIAHETVLRNDRDPPWINNNIKRKILKEKKTAYQSCIQNR